MRRKSFGVGAAALALLSLGLVSAPIPAQASGTIPVVDLAVSGTQVTMSQTTMRPGVVEFHVGKTFTIPGEEGGPDTISIVRTDQLDQVLATLPAVFAGNPEDPASMAAAAAGMAAIHAMTTWYGGAIKGGVWQVNLPVGNYYALGVQSTAMGMAQAAAFTVAGTPRQGSLHATQLTVRAEGPVGANRWVTRQPGMPVEWVNFANASHEIHFLEMSGVKPGTTSGMVKKALFGNSQPKFFTDWHLSFDVISPGVRVAINQDVPRGRYFVDCFIPSEADGMPHALMGMWKLFTVI
jgi:hypothetical protein